MGIKIERISNELQREISYILNEEVKDKDINFVTITDCKVSNDLSYAKVYFTVLNNKETTQIALNKAKGFIRKNLADRIDIRHIPELSFVYDESIEYSNKIESIIEEIHEQ